MDNKQKKEIQKAYLGPLYVPISRREVKIMDAIFNEGLRTSYFRGKNKGLKKIAVYFLLKFSGFSRYRYVTSSEILSSWLGKEDGNGSSEKSHINLSSSILIVHNVGWNPPNKALEVLLCQQVSERENRGLLTLFLDEGDMALVRKMMLDYEMYVHEGDTDSVFGYEKKSSSLDEDLL